MNEVLGEYYSGCFGIKINLDMLDEFEDPSEAGILFIRSTVAPPDSSHLDFIHSQPTQQLKYLSIKLFTLLIHEGRHWTDIASTPFGFYVNLQMLSYYLNSLSAYSAFYKLENIRIPLKNYKNEGLESINRTIDKNYALLDKIDGLFNQSTQIGNKPISSIDILESLAILQQEKFIEKYLDVESLSIFQARIMADENPGYLIKYLKDTAGFDDLGTYQLLYYSLFGCKSTLPVENLDLSPPAILNNFLSTVVPGSNVKEQCDESLIKYQGYPSFASLYLSEQKASQHFQIIRDQLTVPDAKISMNIALLLKSIEGILRVGRLVFEFIYSSPELSLNSSFGYYFKESWPLVFYESSLGFSVPEEWRKSFYNVYLGFRFNDFDKKKMLDILPFKLRSTMDTVLTQMERQPKNYFMTLFSTISPTSNDYFGINELYPTLLYFDVLFRGKTVLNMMNMRRFEQTYINPPGYLNPFGQRLIDEEEDPS